MLGIEGGHQGLHARAAIGKSYADEKGRFELEYTRLCYEAMKTLNSNGLR